MPFAQNNLVTAADVNGLINTINPLVTHYKVGTEMSTVSSQQMIYPSVVETLSNNVIALKGIILPDDTDIKAVTVPRSGDLLTCSQSFTTLSGYIDKLNKEPKIVFYKGNWYVVWWG